MKGAVGLVALAIACVGCGRPRVDLKTNLQVVDVSTGWADAGLINGQNKLVPTVSFKLKNTSDRTLDSLQANVVFRRLSDETEWGSLWLRVTGSEGLAPNAASKTLTASSQHGYTGTEPRQQMLQNSLFVDGRVQLFAKYNNTQWTPIGEFPVTRQLLAK